MKQIILGLIVGLIIIVGIGLVYMSNNTSVDQTPTATPTGDDTMPVEPDGGIGDGAEPLTTEADMPSQIEGTFVLGQSAGGEDIIAHSFGSGADNIVFIGGIHGGYSGNTTLVANELIQYLETNQNQLADNLRVTVIPTMNPDGIATTLGSTNTFTSTDLAAASEADRVAGRFNANTVDLNRNFDCQWQAAGTWRDQSVSGGTAPFSEPETQAVRDYIDAVNPVAAVVWYSAAGEVFASSCNGTVAADTTTLMNTFADAAGYPSQAEFDYYEITGDMVNWMAKQSIPAISVLLSDHSNPEWTKNQAGIEAVLNLYAE